VIATAVDKTKLHSIQRKRRKLKNSLFQAVEIRSLPNRCQHVRYVRLADRKIVLQLHAIEEFQNIKPAKQPQTQTQTQTQAQKTSESVTIYRAL
jgi:hypothetical protein